VRQRLPAPHPEMALDLGCFLSKKPALSGSSLTRRVRKMANEGHLFAVLLSQNFLWRNIRLREAGPQLCGVMEGAIISRDNDSPSPHGRLTGNPLQIQVVCTKLKKPIVSPLARKCENGRVKIMPNFALLLAHDKGI